MPIRLSTVRPIRSRSTGSSVRSGRQLCQLRSGGRFRCSGRDGGGRCGRRWDRALVAQGGRGRGGRGRGGRGRSRRVRRARFASGHADSDRATLRSARLALLVEEGARCRLAFLLLLAAAFDERRTDDAAALLADAPTVVRDLLQALRGQFCVVRVVVHGVARPLTARCSEVLVLSHRGPEYRCSSADLLQPPSSEQRSRARPPAETTTRTIGVRGPP